MADDYATWRPQAEADWTSEDIEMLRRERDAARAHAERLGKAGEVYFAELRTENARLRAALAALLDAYITEAPMVRVAAAEREARAALGARSAPGVDGGQ